MALLALALLFGTFALTSVAQGLLVRRRVPRLPPPDGQPLGTVGRGERAIRLLVVGDSSAVGVGVGQYDETLAAHIAALYSERAQCVVHWSVLGKSGATIDDLRRLLLSQPPDLLSADVVVIAIGVNDVLRLRSPVRWRRSLNSLIRSLRAMTKCRTLLLSPIPPLWKFSCLPVPLRYLLGAHAFALDLVSRRVANDDANIRHLRIPLLDQESMLCEDRFHPSSCGYQEWASYVAAAMASGEDPAANSPTLAAPIPERQLRGNESTLAAQMKSF